MPVGQNVADDLLSGCHRRCCICHRFCGVRMEIHHIEQGGSDETDNLIPLCFDCHAEAGHYNVKHPKGRKYQAGELREHRDQWFGICRTNPGALIAGSVSTDAGPLQGLVGELEFNLAVVKTPDARYGHICPISTRQFERVVSEGTMLIIPDCMRQSLSELYRDLGGYNVRVRRYENTKFDTEVVSAADILKRIDERQSIVECLRELRGLLGLDDRVGSSALQ